MGEVKSFPNGLGTFPDFSINDKIGVECTRLVHRIEKDGAVYNLDELEPRIIQSLAGSFKRLQFGSLTASFFVCLDFDIEIELRGAKKLLKNYLFDLTKSNGIIPHRCELSSHLEIELLRSSKVLESPFVLGAMNTRDGGGWVLEQLSHQTRDAIRRKTDHVRKSNHKFEEWWLAVSGSVAVGVSESYAEFITEELRHVEIWDKVLLIDPHEPKRSRIITAKRP